MKLVIRIDPETGEIYGKILKKGEKMPPLTKPNIKKKDGKKKRRPS